MARTTGLHVAALDTQPTVERMDEVKIEINYAAYMMSHGKAPRGEGCWAFSLTKNGDDPIFSTCMTLTDAKEWAREAMELKYGKGNVSRIYVLG